MRYRQAKTSDCEHIAEVLLKNYNLKDMKEARIVAKAELDMYNCIVAEVKKTGQIIGIAGWRQHGLPKHQLVETVRMAIDPELRGKGIARTLFKKMIQDAHKHYRSHGLKLRKLYAYAHTNNKLAMKFYKRRGMIHEATLKDHFYNGESEAIFSMFFE